VVFIFSVGGLMFPFYFAKLVEIFQKVVLLHLLACSLFRLLAVGLIFCQLASVALFAGHRLFLNLSYFLIRSLKFSFNDQSAILGFTCSLTV